MIFSQLLTFVVMFLFGLIMSLCFHGYSLFLKKYNLSYYIISLMDVLWGLFFGCLGFYILLLLNRGQLRIFVLLAVFLGWGVYYYTLKKRQEKIVE